MCPFSHQLKQTVKGRECKMKRNDSKKVDRLVHPLCQHLLVYRSFALYCFFTAMFLLSGKVGSTASTEAPQHRAAAAHSRLLHWHRGLSVCLSVLLLSLSNPWHTHTTPSTPQINLPPCLHNCPFSDCSALCVCACVCVSVCLYVHVRVTELQILDTAENVSFFCSLGIIQVVPVLMKINFPPVNYKCMEGLAGAVTIIIYD